MDVWKDDTEGMIQFPDGDSEADDRALLSMLSEDRALDALLLQADQLATRMQNWSQSEDGSAVSGSVVQSYDGSFAQSASFHGDARSSDNESLHVPSLHQTEDDDDNNVDVEEMLRKADVLVTEIRRSTSGVLANFDSYDKDDDDAIAQVSPVANENDKVDDMLDRAELLAAKMHSVSQSSLDMTDDNDDEEGELDLALLKSSSADYSNSANAEVDEADVLEQADEILKRMEVASNDGTTTSTTSLGSDMAVAHRMGLTFEDHVSVDANNIDRGDINHGGMDHGGIDHGQQVAKAEEMARLMQEALSSHIPLDEANELLHADDENEDVIERVVTALRKTATDDEDEKEEKVEDQSPEKFDNVPQTPTQVPHDEHSFAASESIRSESMRSGSIRSGSNRSGASGQVPPPPKTPPMPQSAPPPPAAPVEKISQERLPTEEDPDYVPVADFRPKKVTSPPATRPSAPGIPKVITPPPPRRPARPAVVSAEDDDFVPVADFSSNSNSANQEKVVLETTSPRSVRWERVERAYQQDDDFVPLMDFRDSAPKQNTVMNSILPLTPKLSRKARRRMLIRGVIVALVVGYTAWRLLKASRTTRHPSVACPDDKDPSRCSIENATLDLSDDTMDLVQEESTLIETTKPVRISWNYPGDICQHEDESFANETEGVCEITDLATTEEEKEVTTGKPKRGLRLPPFVCKIPHLSNLLARHCRHTSQ